MRISKMVPSYTWMYKVFEFFKNSTPQCCEFGAGQKNKIGGFCIRKPRAWIALHAILPDRTCVGRTLQSYIYFWTRFCRIQHKSYLTAEELDVQTTADWASFKVFEDKAQVCDTCWATKGYELSAPSPKGELYHGACTSICAKPCAALHWWWDGCWQEYSCPRAHSQEVQQSFMLCSLICVEVSTR
jgi:hypothetical protein